MKSIFKALALTSIIAVFASGAAYANHHKKHHAKKQAAETKTEMTQEKSVLQKDEKAVK